MSYRILVTGSSGFIGSALVAALLAAGHSVRAVSRTPGHPENLERITWVKLSNLEDGVDWDPLVDGMDIVVHLAAIADRRTIESDLHARVNAAASADLSKACQRRLVKRLIYISSIAAQTGSAADHVLTETDEPAPIAAYDRAKLAAEEAIRRSGVPFTILRPVIVYGPGAKSNIALLMRIAALPVPLPFKCFQNRRSLLALDNLVQAIMVCLATPETLNQTFIVCDPEPITVADMFASLREAAGRPHWLFAIPASAIKLMILAVGRRELWDQIGRELVASSAKLQKVGWSPQLDTKSGLRAMVSADDNEGLLRRYCGGSR